MIGIWVSRTNYSLHVYDEYIAARLSCLGFVFLVQVRLFVFFWQTVLGEKVGHYRNKNVFLYSKSKTNFTVRKLGDNSIRILTDFL